MAGEVRTCTNCGNQQATGAFCERCGTRLPEVAPTPPPAAAPVPVAAAPVEPVAAPQVSASPVQYATQPQYAPQPQYVPQPQYAPRVPGPFSKLFDLSFQGFVTRGSLRVLFISTLALLGIYWLFALIFGIVAAVKLQGYWCLGIFSSLALVTLMIIWTRIMMELTMTVSEMRDEVQKTAQAAQAAADAAAPRAADKSAAKATPKTTAKAAAPKATK